MCKRVCLVVVGCVMLDVRAHVCGSGGGGMTCLMCECAMLDIRVCVCVGGVCAMLDVCVCVWWCRDSGKVNLLFI